MCGMTQYAEKGNPMAKLLTKSGFAAPSANVMAAIDGEARAAALRQAAPRPATHRPPASRCPMSLSD